MPRIQALSFYVQLAALAGLLGWLWREYRRFVKDLGRFLVYYPGQGLVLLLLYLLVLGQVGTGLGLPYLFWHEWPIHRALSSLGATLVLALVGINAYYLIPSRLRASLRTRMDEASARQTLKLPFGSWLEPVEGTNAWLLGRYLRVARTPFLLALSLPALLPSVFVNVPRTAPVFPAAPAWVGEWLVLRPESRGADADFRAYLLGLFFWGAGIVAGVLVIKLFIVSARRVNSTVFWAWDWLAEHRGQSRVARVYRAAREAAGARGLIVVPRVDEGPTRGLLAVEPAMVRSIRAFLALFALAYLAMCGVGDRWLPVPPAMAICTMLALGSMTLVGLSFLRLRGRLLLGTLAALWIGVNHHGYYRLRFEGLDYERPVGIDAALIAADRSTRTAPGLATSLDVLEAWTPFARGQSIDPGIKPKLAVVCVTGGAARSAYWSAVVLDRLGQEVAVRDRGPNQRRTFDAHVRLITGASGGMMGAAHYVTHLYDLDRAAPEGQGMPVDWVHAVPTDSLQRVARSMALRAPASLFIPWLVGGDGDRGIALERDWVHLRRVRFADLRPAEHAGRLPSLVVSPMTVEDGRRALITNLDLRRAPRRPAPRATESLAFNRGGDLSADDTNGGGIDAYSRSAFELFKVFPAAGGLLLATAARMSATFPFVSPAAYLPTEPPLRVVDAGYYDGYGVDLAVAWLAEHRDWLLENTSGVVLIQIRDALSRRERLSFPAPDASLYGWALRGYQFFFSPLDAVLSARTSTTMFRNDQAVDNLGIAFRSSPARPPFFTTVVLENSANVATASGQRDRWPVFVPDDLPGGGATANVEMSWYLTAAERRALETAIPSREAARRYLDDEGITAPMESDAALARIRKDVIDLRDKYERAGNKSDEADIGPRKRAYIERLYEQAANYYRLALLDRWWRVDHYPDRAQR